MDGNIYDRVVVLGHGWAIQSVHEPLSRANLRQLEHSSGIYIACGVDGQVQYVGSVRRNRGARALRSREHSRGRRSAWHSFWIVPVRDERPRWIVRAIEGQVIDLSRPPMRPPVNLVRHSVRFVPYHEPGRSHQVA